MNATKVHPVFYIITLGIGYYEGMNSHGNWTMFAWIVLAFIGIRILLRITGFAWKSFV